MASSFLLIWRLASVSLDEKQKLLLHAKMAKMFLDKVRVEAGTNVSRNIKKNTKDSELPVPSFTVKDPVCIDRVASHLPLPSVSYI